MADYQCILIDDPRPAVRRVTLNRPEKRNALNNQLRGEILQALEEADRAPNVRVALACAFQPATIWGVTMPRGSPTIQRAARDSGPAT